MPKLTLELTCQMYLLLFCWNKIGNKEKWRRQHAVVVLHTHKTLAYRQAKRVNGAHFSRRHNKCGCKIKPNSVPRSAEGWVASPAVKMPRAGPSNSFTFSLQHKPHARIQQTVDTKINVYDAHFKHQPPWLLLSVLIHHYSKTYSWCKNLCWHWTYRLSIHWYCATEKWERNQQNIKKLATLKTPMPQMQKTLWGDVKQVILK